VVSARGRGWPLAVRRARPSDKDAVLGFATSTWNGWDYMPRAFDRWLEERDGVLLVGTVGADGATDADGASLDRDQVIAIVRVAMPAEGEGWLEGIRVDPRVRGMDIATDLQVAELHWMAANGARVVRYATSESNIGSHRLGARAGLEQLVSLISVNFGADEEASGFEREMQVAAQRERAEVLGRLDAAGLVAANDDELASRMWRGVSGDASFDAVARLYEPRSWAFEELTESKFRVHVANREVLHGSGADGKAVAVLVRGVAPAEDAALRLALVAGVPQTAFALVEQVRRASNGTLRFRFADDAPVVAAVREQYVAAGYSFWDRAMHILARPIDATHPVPVVDASTLILGDVPDPSIVPAH
jgi:hypothetical protein